MVEVGIPVWHARDTLPKALDSLVAQTFNRFIICLSIDGDGEDYSDIIETYRARGLKIRVINSPENGGPGMARQRVLDTTQCDFIMFLDSDDMLMPRAVQILYNNIRLNNYDIIRSSFIREESKEPDKLMPQNTPSITWFHGKIYKVAYLKEKNIRFLEGLRIDEDAYFNVVAWNSTKNRGEITEVTYIWRNNFNSLTRQENSADYFKKNYLYYIRSQVEGMKKIVEISGEVSNTLVAQTLINLYYYYMQARFYGLPEDEMIKLLSSFKKEQWMQVFLSNGRNWIDIVQNLKGGLVIDDSVVFFQEVFSVWATRLLKAD